MATGYEYKPLNRARQDIRLLCFDTKNLSEYALSTKPLNCTIKQVSTLIDPLPEYYAISYTWGDNRRRGSILVDGKAVTIPLNAEAALRYFIASKISAVHTIETHILLDSPCLVTSPEDQESLLSAEWLNRGSTLNFWLDSLSIDQSDLEEKSWQLLMISDVFSQAKEVWIWLGEDINGSAKAAMNSIALVVEQCRNETHNLNDLLDVVWALNPKELNPRSSTARLPLTCDLVALATFYSSPWFQRLWVLQESILGNRPMCHYGKNSIPLYDVVLAARWIWHRTFGRFQPEDDQYTNHTIGIQNAATIWDVLSNPFIVPRTLSNLLLLGMRFNTTDPRDHVYAILGLLNDIDFAKISSDLLPDYTISLAELYTRITRTIIDDTQNLFILKIGSTLVGTTGRSEDALDVPTWVPRYDWIYDVNKGSPCTIRPTGKGTYAGSGMSTRLLKGLPAVLSVQGILVDHIAYLAGPWEPIKDGSQPFKSQIAETWAMALTYGSKDLYASLEFAYAATICAGRNKYLQDIADDSRFYVNCAAFFGWCGPLCKSLYEYFSDSQDKKHTTENLDVNEEITKAMTQNSRNLRFFVTWHGRLGLAPKTAQLRDKVCLLPGCNVPVILRKNGVFWRYVGDAYVYDIMNAVHFHHNARHGTLESELEWFNIE